MERAQHGNKISVKIKINCIHNQARLVDTEVRSFWRKLGEDGNGYCFLQFLYISNGANTKSEI
jgi:hypothetical protein